MAGGLNWTRNIQEVVVGTKSEGDGAHVGRPLRFLCDEGVEDLALRESPEAMQPVSSNLPYSSPSSTAPSTPRLAGSVAGPTARQFQILVRTRLGQRLRDTRSRFRGIGGE